MPEAGEVRSSRSASYGFHVGPEPFFVEILAYLFVVLTLYGQPWTKVALRAKLMLNYPYGP